MREKRFKMHTLKCFWFTNKENRQIKPLLFRARMFLPVLYWSAANGHYFLINDLFVWNL